MGQVGENISGLMAQNNFESRSALCVTISKDALLESGLSIITSRNTPQYECAPSFWRFWYGSA